MKFDLENLNPGTWFYFDDDNPKDGRICLRICPMSETERINKATSKKVVKKFKGVPYDSYEQDNDAASRMIWDYSIVAWEGVQDSKGKNIECNVETKAVLMNGHPAFSQFVMEKLNYLKSKELSHEALEKN